MSLGDEKEYAKERGAERSTERSAESVAERAAERTATNSRRAFADLERSVRSTAHVTKGDGGFPPPAGDESTSKDAAFFFLDDQQGASQYLVERSETQGTTTKLRHPSTVTLDEKLRSFVVIEVVEGHQIIGNWRCGDLVYYVNHLGGGLTRASRGEYVAETPGATAASFTRVSQKPKQAPGLLTYRDLKQVFTDGSPVPSVEVRRNCIVFCLPPLSCIMMVDRVFLLVVQDLNMDALISRLRALQLRRMVMTKSDMRDLASSQTTTGMSPAGDDPSVIGPETPLEHSSQMTTTQAVAADANYPLEFEVFELLVSAAFEQLDSDVSHLELQMAATEKTLVPTTEKGEDLHILKGHIRVYQDRVSLIDKAFDELRESPEDLLCLELSRVEKEKQQKEKIRGLSTTDDSSIEEEPNPDLEILVEFFDQELELFSQRLNRLSEKVDAAERIITLKLSLTRNTLLRWDVASSMGAVAMGVGTLVSGLFGMNLYSGLEDSRKAFQVATSVIVCLTFVLLVFIFVVIKMARL